jgi:hypothetical protein
MLQIYNKPTHLIGFIFSEPLDLNFELFQ